MSDYRVIQEHVCDLPDPGDFPNGTQIACTGYDYENRRPCWKSYHLWHTFWTRRPYWLGSWEL